LLRRGEDDFRQFSQNWTPKSGCAIIQRRLDLFFFSLCPSNVIGTA
jgi:hypothetical protein